MYKDFCAIPQDRKLLSSHNILTIGPPVTSYTHIYSIMCTLPWVSYEPSI